MAIATQRFVASLRLILEDGTATPYFRDFLARVEGFIQQAGVVSTWGGVGGTLSDQTDLQNALDGKATTAQGALADTALQEYEAPAFRNEATDPYSLVIGDANRVLRFTTANADVTIPDQATVAYPDNTEISIRQAGTGTLTLTTTGLTINGTLPSWAQHEEVRLRKVGTDEWDVVA